MSNQLVEDCTQYLQSLDSDSDEERLAELEEEVEELETERAALVSDYGEDDVLVQRLDEELADRRTAVEDLTDSLTETEALETTILETVALEYVAEDAYLSEPVLEALNHITAGERAPRLLIMDYELTPETTLDSDLRTVSDYVRKLAMAKLGTDDSLANLWDSIEGRKRHDPFLAVARADEPLSPAAVAEQIDDIDSGDAGNRLRSLIHHVDYSPYHRVDGDYTLSNVGKFLYQTYADDAAADTADSSESEADGDDSPDEQVTLDDTAGNDD